ncbi:MAG: response regulator receiver protein [Bacteroidota bacterium]
MTNILSISAHEDIRRIMNRVVNKREGWQGQAAADVNEAEAMLIEEEFDLILIGVGITEKEEQQLSDFCQTLTFTPKLVRHYGGGSGLIYSEVVTAMAA